MRRPRRPPRVAAADGARAARGRAWDRPRPRGAGRPRGRRPAGRRRLRRHRDRPLGGRRALRPAPGGGAGHQRRGAAQARRARPARPAPRALRARLHGVRERHGPRPVPRGRPRRRPGLPQHLRADEVRGRAACARLRAAGARRAPEHRRGGEHHRLDELVQRALPAAARAGPRAGGAGAGGPGRDRGRRARRPRGGRHPQRPARRGRAGHAARRRLRRRAARAGPRVGGRGRPRASRAGDGPGRSGPPAGRPGGLRAVLHRADAVRRGPRPRTGLAPAPLGEYLPRLLAYADRARWGKLVLPRPGRPEPVPA